MWVSVSTLLKQKQAQFQTGMQNTQVVHFLNAILKEHYPFFIPYIQYQSFQNNILTIKVNEPLVLQELNTQKERLRIALKRHNIIVDQVKFTV